RAAAVALSHGCAPQRPRAYHHRSRVYPDHGGVRSGGYVRRHTPGRHGRRIRLHEAGAPDADVALPPAGATASSARRRAGPLERYAGPAGRGCGQHLSLRRREASTGIMGTFGIQEILVLIIVILVLQKTGLWRIISDGLRELRGERPTGAGGASGPAGDYRFFFQSLGISPS